MGVGPLDIGPIGGRGREIGVPGVPRAPYDYAAAPPALLDRALRIKAVCERHGVPLRAAALAFPLRHPAVASVLVGARSAAEVRDAAEQFGQPVPQALWEELGV
ncbi:hypothetical protein A8W25_04685 [Streptomyces sp. ERV7]|nr:hypothetical protein A8W25_04685 [Streptomyces sp. ERV7]